MTGLTSRT